MTDAARSLSFARLSNFPCWQHAWFKIVYRRIIYRSYANSTSAMSQFLGYNILLGVGEHLLRLLMTFLCLTVAACSTPQISSTRSTSPPTDAVIAVYVAAFFALYKLPGTPEVSPIRATVLTEPGDWIICFKSSVLDQPGRYAVFFHDNKPADYRIAVSIDNCDKETYAPLKK